MATRKAGTIGCMTFTDASGTIVHRYVYDVIRKVVIDTDALYSETLYSMSDPDSLYPLPVSVANTDIIDCEVWA